MNTNDIQNNIAKAYAAMYNKPEAQEIEEGVTIFTITHPSGKTDTYDKKEIEDLIKEIEDTSSRIMTNDDLPKWIAAYGIDTKIDPRNGKKYKKKSVLTREEVKSILNDILKGKYKNLSYKAPDGDHPPGQRSLRYAGLTEDNTNNVSDDGEGLDKVQPKALKKKFKDRKDKDIDNDGDVDKSDKYLDNRRKTVSKAITTEDDDPCWDSHEMIGMKKKNGKTVPNCVPKNEAIEHRADIVLATMGEGHTLDEAEEMFETWLNEKHSKCDDPDCKECDDDYGDDGDDREDKDSVLKKEKGKGKVDEKSVKESTQSDMIMATLDLMKTQADPLAEAKPAGKMTSAQKAKARALAKADKDAQPKDKVSLKKAPWDESVEVDEASKEGTIRIIDLSDAHPDNRMGATEKSGFQVQRMTKGKFVNQGKPYAKKAQAEKERSSGQASMQFEGVKATGAQAKALHKLMLRAIGKKQMPTTRNGHTSSIATNGDFVVHGSMGQVAGRIKKGDFVDPMKESVQISEATDFKSTFDGLKKGDTVKIKYGSSLSKGQEGTFKVTFKSIVGKAKVGKITLVKQGEGAAKLKHYLYDRNGKVSMAMGDMGASMTSLVKESVNIEEGAISKKLTGLVDKGLNKILDKLEKMTGKHLGFVQRSTVPSAGKDRGNEFVKFKKEAEDFHRKAKKQWTWSKKEVGDSFRYYGDDGKIPPEQREAVSDLQAEMQRIIDMHTQLEKMMQTTGNSAKYQRTMEKLDSDTSRVFEEIGKVTERGDARYRAAQGIANLKKANKMTHKNKGQKSPAKFRSYANRGESVDESFLDRIKFTPKTSVENLSEKKNSYLMKKIKEDAETTDTWKDQVANRRVDRVAPSGTGMTEADFVAMHSPENAEVYDFVNAPVVIAKTHETIANSTSEGPKRHNDTDDGDANIVRKGT